MIFFFYVYSMLMKLYLEIFSEVLWYWDTDTNYKGTYRVNLEEAFYFMLCDVRADEFNLKTLNETD